MKAMRKSVAATIIILAFVIASATVYGLINLNSTIQAKPEQSQNYSSQIGTLQPQISSINNSISSLGTLKSDISDIKGKLSDLETKLTQAQQATTVSSPVIVLDRSSYFQSDTIYLIAAGLDPQKAAQIQLLDSAGNVITQAQTRPDSSGKLTYNMPIPSNLTPGFYKIKIISDKSSSSQPIIVSAVNQNPPTLDYVYPLTATIDKTIYLRGEQVQVSGIGKPLTTVNAIFTSPSGRSYSTATTTSSNGAYQLYFATSLSFETGYWSLGVTNDGQRKGLFSFYMAADGATSPAGFTVQSNKMFYSGGETIQISGVATPFTTVDAVLTSPSGKAYIASTNTRSDGSYQLSFNSQSYETGYWNLNVTNQGQGKGFSFYVGTSSISSTTFTAQTDKTIYLKGEQIRISGAGNPYSTVTAILKSTSGTTYGSTVSTIADGSYSVFFSTSSSYETGNWNITITNGSVTKTISIFLEPRS